jgi:hypothetical protein
MGGKRCAMDRLALDDSAWELAGRQDSQRASQPASQPASQSTFCPLYFLFLKNEKVHWLAGRLARLATSAHRRPRIAATTTLVSASKRCFGMLLWSSRTDCCERARGRMCG